MSSFDDSPQHEVSLRAFRQPLLTVVAIGEQIDHAFYQSVEFIEYVAAATFAGQRFRKSVSVDSKQIFQGIDGSAHSNTSSFEKSVQAPSCRGQR